MPSPVQTNCDAHDTIANGQYGAVWSMGHTQQARDIVNEMPDESSTLSDRGLTAAVAEWYRYRIVAGIVTSLSPVPRKTRRVEQRRTLNLSRAETSSYWCGS
ncbi:hypothetical protein TNCV_4428441 [Trichonephila clavipes]|nr:hypothetical protein TNCV_4428441 [Trichonephila clavipes]